MADKTIGAGRLAVITGASTGIGFELARQAVDHGFDVLITADDEQLYLAGIELASSGTQVATLRTDLSVPEGVEQLLHAIGPREVELLALNAGIGNGGPFIEISLADEERLIGLNVNATVHLAKRLLPPMVERGSGWVLFTSSVAARMPGPYYATYAASKAFVLSFAEALRHEVRDSGVTITALLPGPTETEFFSRAGMDDAPVADAPKDDPADVARDGFQALLAGKDHVVAGSLKNKAQLAAARLLSEPAKAALHASMTRPVEE